MRSHLNMLFFFWTSSFAIATLSYYVLWLIVPAHRVFGSWYRMIGYHYDHPTAFIAVPCFFYGIVATLAVKRFLGQPTRKRISTTAFIALIVIVVSSPLGGILWHFFDMQAGFFPENWVRKLVLQGALDGLEMGWLIILLSFPYNVLGSISAYYLTKKGSELYTGP